MNTAKRESVGLLLKKVSSDQTTRKEVAAQTTDRPRSARPRRRHFHSHSGQRQRGRAGLITPPITLA